MTTKAAIVVLPTYNEIESLPEVIARLQAVTPQLNILIVDDASPDGTGALADRMSQSTPNIHVLHRTEKQGLGPAYIAGFARALELGFEIIVQSDADGSHRPEDLPDMLAALADADVVIGSRWVPGGSAPDWALHRYLLSRAGSAYARLLLGLRQRDITGGYRVFKSEVLSSIRPEQVTSRGFCFQIEMLQRAVRAKYRVIEVPIVFDDRLHGDSKMSGKIVFEALLQVTHWGIARLFGRDQFATSGSACV